MSRKKIYKGPRDRYNKICTADRKAWWRSLTLEEQAEYVYNKKMMLDGQANYQEIYKDLYDKGLYLK